MIIIMALLFGCSKGKEEEQAGSSAMWEKGLKVEPGMELVFLSDTELNEKRRVLCSHYLMTGCVPGSGKRIKVRMVELLTIQYKTRKQACEAAKCDWAVVCL